MGPSSLPRAGRLAIHFLLHVTQPCGEVHCHVSIEIGHGASLAQRTTTVCKSTWLHGWLLVDVAVCPARLIDQVPKNGATGFWTSFLPGD